MPDLAEPTKPLLREAFSYRKQRISPIPSITRFAVYLDPPLGERPYYLPYLLYKYSFSPFIRPGSGGSVNDDAFVSLSLSQRVYRTYLCIRYRAIISRQVLSGVGKICACYMRLVYFGSSGTCILVCILYRTIPYYTRSCIRWRGSVRPRRTPRSETNKQEKKRKRQERTERRSFIKSSTYGICIASCSSSSLHQPSLTYLISIALNKQNCRHPRD